MSMGGQYNDDRPFLDDIENPEDGDECWEEEKTCRNCKATPLYWDHQHYYVTGRWRLVDANGAAHVCRTPAQLDFEPVS